MNNAIKILGRGFNGWHGAGDNFSTSGGTLEPVKWWAGGMTRGYLIDCADGTPVYDAEHLTGDSADEYARFIVGGCMPKSTIPSGHIQVTDYSGVWPKDSFVPFNENEKLGAFDFVAVDVYIRLMRARIPGVKFGVVKDHKIIWES